MGWRGTLRAIAAAQRAAERESIRRQKRLLQAAKYQAKLDALNQAQLECDEYENWIDRITSVHQDCGTSWNWREIAATAAPSPPVYSNDLEARAAREEKTYRPSWWERLFRRQAKRRAQLADAVRKGLAEDRRRHAEAVAKYERELAEWREMNLLAQRIHGGDTSAYDDAINELAPFAELTELGSRLNVKFGSATTAEVAFQVNSERVIPRETKSLLQSGKLSVKRMPQGRFFELYQDYVCGSTFRIARELFAVVPLETAVITAWANQLDSSSGHMKDQPILSVVIPRKTLNRLNFANLDPSDALSNFVHNMDFKKTKGFAAVTALRLNAMREEV
jgi:hypothetical protein